jgi:hypothetical protein
VSILKLGRVGVDFMLDSPESEQWNGQSVALTGRLRGTTTANLLAIREQLLGYDNNLDEPIIPVVSDDDPSLTGYYRIGSIAVSAPSGSLSSRWLPMSLQLDRVKSAVAPIVEARLLMAPRYTGATVTYWHAVPSAALGYEPMGTAANGVAQFPRLASVMVFGSPLASARQRFQLPPANWYDGAALLSVNGNVIVGRQCPNTPGSWSLTNGELTISPTTDTGNIGIRVAALGGALTAANVDVWSWSGSAYGKFAATPNRITILRNDPAAVSIRLGWDNTSGYIGQSQTLDVTLRRGARMAECRFVDIVRTTPLTLAVGLAPMAAASSVVMNQAIKAASGSDPYVLATPETAISDTTNGALRGSAGSQTFRFGVGYQFQSAVTPNLAADMASQYFAAGGETVAVVGR